MTDRKYDKCKTCREWGWVGTHTCPPIWEARVYENKYENSWSEVHANSAEVAATKFAEEYDCHGDYDIVKRGCEEIEVRRLGDETIIMVDVSAETVPKYYGEIRRER